MERRGWYACPEGEVGVFSAAGNNGVERRRLRRAEVALVTAVSETQLRITLPVEGWCERSRLVFVGLDKPITQLYYEVADESSGCAGRYYRSELKRYHGVPGFRQPGTHLALYRWRQKHWLLGDLGLSMDNFGEESASYIVPTGRPALATPVTDEPWLRGPGADETAIDRIHVAGPFEELCHAEEILRHALKLQPKLPPATLVPFASSEVEWKVAPPPARPSVNPASLVAAPSDDDFIIVEPDEDDPATFVILETTEDKNKSLDTPPLPGKDASDDRCGVQ